MGIVICEKHGKQGFKINIEKSIVDHILADSPLAGADLVVVTLSFFDEAEFLYEDKILLKKSTFIAHGFNSTYTITNEREEAQIMPPLNELLTGVCGKCYAEYMLKQHISIDF